MYWVGLVLYCTLLFIGLEQVKHISRVAFWAVYVGGVALMWIFGYIMGCIEGEKHKFHDKR